MPLTSHRLPESDEPVIQHEPEQTGELLASARTQVFQITAMVKVPGNAKSQCSMENFGTRQRYWGRSLIGWPVIRNAAPNPSHHYIADLEVDFTEFRFCRYGKELDKPIAILNLGRARAEALVELKLNARTGGTLKVTLDQL